MRGFYHKWTEEEDCWLKKYYPSHGTKDTLDAFCKKFSPKIRKRQLEGRVGYLGIHLNDDVYAAMQKERGRTLHEKYRSVHPIGFVNPDNGMIKTENGWKRLGAILGLPKGYYAVHLDGDVTNNNPDNIAVVSHKTSMQMTLNKFWSEHPEITKAGILCCELEQLTSEKISCAKNAAYIMREKLSSTEEH